MIRERNLVIVSAGVMGTNIATLAIGHGVPVTLVDVSEDILTQARWTVTQKLRHALGRKTGRGFYDYGKVA